MITCAALWAVVLRHMRVWKHDPNALLFNLYWPVLDILTWGYLGAWIQQSQHAGLHNYETIALLSVLLWQVVGRGSNIILNTFTEELWSNNIINLFALPLRLGEWICGVICVYAIMISFTIGASLASIFFLYKNVSMLVMLRNFLLFFPPLFLSGIWLGFTALQVVVLLGKRGMELGFVIVWFFMPFSGAYYPVEILPNWAQVVSTFLPMTYVFQGMRAYIMHGYSPATYLIKGYALGALYAILSLMLFIYCFNLSKSKGLARLCD